jgi:hypothetical protein
MGTRRDVMRKNIAARAPAPALRAAQVGIRIGRRLGYARSRWPAPIGTRPPTFLAVAAIFRNEAPYLAEWVTFHRLMGVERFYLYDNLSTDHWRSALEPELRSGVVEVIPWPAEPGQFSAYEDCVERHRLDTRWIAFLDVDEFLFSPTRRPLPAVLSDYATHPGVVANWRVFGTSGHGQRPNGLVTESYLYRARDDRDVNRFVKSIIYPRKTEALSSTAHAFRHYGRAVGEDGVPRPDESAFRTPPTADVLRINHYYSKSSLELRQKLARGRPDLASRRPDDEVEMLIRHGNEVLDKTILRHLPALKHALAARRPQATLNGDAALRQH